MIKPLTLVSHRPGRMNVVAVLLVAVVVATTATVVSPAGERSTTDAAIAAPADAITTTIDAPPSASIPSSGSAVTASAAVTATNGGGAFPPPLDDRAIAPDTVPQPGADTDVEAPITVDKPELLIDGPQTAQVGQPFVITVDISTADSVAAYQLDATSVDNQASIDPVRPGRLNRRDTVADRSIGNLGSRAVLAATSCPNGGCADGTTPVGASGIVELGAFAIVADQPGIIEIEISAPQLVDPNGNPLANSPTGRRIEIAVSGQATAPPQPPNPAPSAPASDPSAPAQPRSVSSDPETVAFEWHSGVLDGCVEQCLSVADIQAASLDPPPAPVATAGLGNTYTVDSTSDVAAWDSNPGNGVCATAIGSCTLRAAMQEAKNDPGPNAIHFNLAGPGPHTIELTSRLPAFTDQTGATTIDGYTQPGAQPNSDPLVSNAIINVEVRGTGPFDFDAFVIRSSNNVVRGLAVYDVRRPFWIYGAGTDDNVIVGNYIGTDATGTFQTATLAPTAHGVQIEQQAERTIVGTALLADRNVISGNARHGLGIWSNNTDGTIVQNNIVGLDPSGTVSLPNAKHGLDVNFGAADTRLGGSGPGEGNLISGNADSGVEVSHTAETVRTIVVGNRIGTAPDGESATAETANGNTGVFVEDAVVDTVIEGNVIGNNLKGGIRIINGGVNGITTGTVVRNNSIGVSVGGVPLPNGQVGVSVDGSNSVIGPGNEIANNPTGVMVNEFDALGNTITQNSIHDNDIIGIELSPPGSNLNDPDDADNGPNDLLNHPEFDRATEAVFEGTACANCVVEVFTTDTSGAFLAGAQFVVAGTTDAIGIFSIANPSATVGVDVTATATDTAGNTSEFTPAIAVSVHSDAPTVDAGSAVSVNEGASVQLIASGSDPDGGPVTYDWDLDGDLVYETPGQTVTFDASAIDGPALVTVGVRVTDVTLLTGTDTVDVTVDNVAPSGTASVPTDANEGSDFSVSIDSASDPSPADMAAGLRYVIFCPGEVPVVPDYATASIVSARTCTAPDGPASVDVVTQIIDDDNGYSEQNSPVIVANVDPSVSIIGMPAGVAEGDQLSLTAGATDASVDDEAAGLAITWVVTLDAVVVATNTGSSLVVDIVDDGAWVISADATDKDGGVGTAVGPLTASNVAPTATFDTVVAVTGQVTIDLSLVNPVDPGLDDVTAGLRYAFDCVGAPLGTITFATASPTPTMQCVFTSGATLFPLSAAIVDKDDGLTTYATTASTGGNAPPTVDAGPFFGAEGSSIQLTATGTDPEGGPLDYDWDLDGDLVYETPGQTVMFDASSTDGPAIINVGVRVTDFGGLESFTVSTITVDNVAPVASLGSVAADEGQPYTIDLSAATDPSTADAASLRFAFDCQGGSLASVVYATAGTSPTIDCTYPDGPATGSVAARVLDDDGGTLDISASVTVANADPTVVLTPPGPTAEGDTAVIVLTPYDPGPIDVASLATSWTVDDGGGIIASGTGTTATFIAPDGGTFIVAASVIDKDGGTGAATLAVDVSGVAPTATFVVPATADEGSSVTLQLTGAFDPSSADTAAGLHYSFSCDGSPITATYATASPSSSVGCVVGSPGVAVVAARVIDIDDLFTEYTDSIVVGDLAPTARFDVAREVDQYQDITLGASLPSESGLEYSFDCGSGFGSYATTNSIICVSNQSPGFRTVGLRIRDAQFTEQTYTAVVVVHRDLTGNGSFELGDEGLASGWSFPLAATVVTAGARTGTRAIEVSSVMPTTAVIRTDFISIERVLLQMGGWINVVDAGTNVEVQVRVVWTDDTNSTISTSVSPTISSVTGGYVELGRTALPPPTATKAKLQIFVTTDGGARVRIDDIDLRPANAVENPDFDLDVNLDARPDEWWSLSRFVTATDPVHASAGSARLTNDGAGFTPGQKIDVVGIGQTYLASVWIRVADNPGQIPIRLRVRWKDPSNNTLGLDVLEVLKTATPGWVQLSGTAVAPVGATAVNFELRVANGLTQPVFIDSAFLGPS